MISRLIIFIISAMYLGEAARAQTGAAPRDMALIPSGSYVPLYGDAEEVRVEPFLLDKYPVTDAEFKMFIDANENWAKGNVKTIFADRGYLKSWTAGGEPVYEKPWTSPVTNVSWFAAKAFCQWKGKRLPTTNEWEYVGMASATKPNAANNREFYQTLLNWYSVPNPAQYPSVEEGFKNYYGVYGIHGMIWEWVYDFNSALLVGESRANAGIDRNLFCASGSLNARDTENYVAFLRYAFRSSLKANYTVSNLGFRCAKDL